MENAREKVIVMLGEYQIDKYTKEQTSQDLLYDFFADKLSNGEIDDIVDNTETKIIIEVDGYEFTIDKETLRIINEPRKAGIKPIFEVQITKIDGTTLTGGESKKALTVNITNMAEYGNNYEIEMKDKDGKIVIKQTDVVGNIKGQASFIITQSGDYTIVVKGTKYEITKIVSKVETITVARETTTAQFTKANGVIDIVWLDMDNNVIGNPISPSSYLGGMTAIKYNGTNWISADTTNTGNDWYNYVAQTGTVDGRTSNWANAKKTSGGNEVNFVWIPRYAYKITYFDTETNKNAYRRNNLSTAGIVGYSTIEGMIEYINGTLKLVDGTAPTNVIGTVKTKEYEDYIPHPAFEFEGEKAGIWVGKYETSGRGLSSAVTIIPNTRSLTNIEINYIFTLCQEVKTIYGLTSDSHMMKNTEWGVVAYLTESKYGRNGTEVAINRSTKTTGGGNYKGNIFQSTTGNIYGIYDVNGTSMEYVAGYIDNSNVSSNGYNTNLLNAVATNGKYADIYKTTNDSDANNYAENKGVKGDAVYETSTSYNGANSWHADYSAFPSNVYPVFLRDR